MTTDRQATDTNGPWMVPCARSGEKITVRVDAHGLFYSEHLCVVLIAEALNRKVEDDD